MVDIETLGTSQDAMILEVGVVMFEPVAHGKVCVDRIFHRHVSPIQAGRVMDSSTLAWWLEQADEARAGLSAGLRTAYELPALLVQLGEWLQEEGPERVWARGPTFDLSLLEHAYEASELPRPWAYNAPRDTRTLEFVLGEPDEAQVEARLERLCPGFVQHNALHDAIRQAIGVTVCLASR